MRNLALVDCKEFPVDCVSSKQKVLIALDSLNSVVYIATTDSIQAFDLTGQKTETVILNMMEENDELVTMDFLSDQVLLCFTTCLSGQIFTYESGSCAGVENVGIVSGGIAGGSWSPDLELFLLVTSDQSLYLMSREFDVIEEVSLHTETSGREQPVAVGWGKKETQFHGSAGKQAALLKYREATEVLPWDDCRVGISWRGDGQFFVLSFVCPRRRTRVIRIFGRDSLHLTTCEETPGLGQSIAWKYLERPSGGLIASSCHCDDSHKIIFYEKNGLRHGEFVLKLPDTSFKVVSLCWNLDSTILFVWLEGTDPSRRRSYLELWTCSNYYWYLKQCLEFLDDHQLSCLSWDAECPMKLHVLTKKGLYRVYHWSFTVSSASVRSAPVAVIDGDELKMTFLKHQVIPPPMHTTSCRLESPISSVAFAPLGNSCLALLSDQRIALVQLSFQPCKLECVGTFRIEGFQQMGVLYHPVMIDSSTLFVVQVADGHYRVLRIDTDIHYWQTSVKDCWGPLVHSVVSLLYDGQETLALESDDGSWRRFEIPGSTVVDGNDGVWVEFRTPCYNCTLIRHRGALFLLALNNGHQLFINDRTVASNVNSFIVHSRWLLVTTLDQKLFCVPLVHLGDQDTSLKRFTHRNIERGSLLVSAVSDGTSVILQMPRGNLETIHPRPLIISKAAELLNGRQFKAALVLMKKHRVNSNLFYDHNPKTFQDEVESILKEVSSPELLNIFVMELRDEDVTVSLYSDVYCEGRPSRDSAFRKGKVDSVCLLLRESFERNPDVKMACFTVYLSTFIKHSSKETDEALLAVKQMMGNEELVSESLTHLLYLVDPNTLFNMALATYDFNLVLLVAERSQKDPKEFLPFLNQLRQYESSYMKYKIEMHLERFGRALSHIASCEGHFEECLELIKQKVLYHAALRLFPSTTTEHKRVSGAFANYLWARKQYKDAAVLYRWSGDPRSSLRCYARSGDWRSCFCLCEELKATEDEVISVGDQLSLVLTERRDYSGAGQVLSKFNKDPEKAVKVLCSGELWTEAIMVAVERNREDLIDSVFLPALKERTRCAFDLLETCETELRNHYDRLSAVREEKRQKMKMWTESKGEFNVEESEVFSEASSLASISSDRSGMSGRSRKTRRAERKKRSMKKGSRYEDIALMNAIKQVLLRIDNIHDGVRETVHALWAHSMRTDASLLQQKFSDTCVVARNCSEKTWPKTWEVHCIPGPVDEAFVHADNTAELDEFSLTNSSWKFHFDTVMQPPQLRNELRNIDTFAFQVKNHE